VLGSYCSPDISALGACMKSRKGDCPETEVELPMLFALSLLDALLKSGQAR